MVFNVRKKGEIKVRMASIDEDIWPQPSITKKLPADPSQRIGFSKYIESGRVVYQEVIEKIYASVNKEFGTKEKPPTF